MVGSGAGTWLAQDTVIGAGQVMFGAVLINSTVITWVHVAVLPVVMLLAGRVEVQQQKAAKSERQPCKVNEGVALVVAQVAQGDFEVGTKHDGTLMDYDGYDGLCFDS